MADITHLLPQESEVVTRIFEWHKKQGDSEPERGYLGASILGHDCSRYLWYTFRNCVKRNFEGRLYRLFETGDLAEFRFVKELQGIGCEVHEVDENGKQFAVNFLGGHGSGHTDGCALNIPEAPKTWHVLEFKTHNAKSFAKLQKEGVQKSKPQHYAQCQIYMGLTGMKRTLYLACNKNTDDLYAERIKFNSKDFKALISKAKGIIESNVPPERIATRPDTFACKFCDAYDLCWAPQESHTIPMHCITCRTCLHSTPEIDKYDHEDPARWSCAFHLKRSLTFEEQLEACSNHLFIPDLVHFAKVNNAGKDWVEYQNLKDQAIWVNGTGGKGNFTSLKLIGGDFEKNEPIPFEVPNLDLLHQYPWADTERLWDGVPADIADALEKLGLSRICDMQPDREEENTEAIASEYEGNILIVQYKDSDSAAIWKGKE